MRNIYSAVTEAGTALNLSKDELSGVFLALGQMISKGKVQAEELRGQLGERLPGAFGLAAKAMGVTTGELDKLLETGKVTAEDMLPKLADALHNKFGKAAKEAAEGGAQAVNRMSTEWEDLKANVLDNGTMISGIRGVTGALKDANEQLLLRKMIDSGMRGDIQSMGDDYTVSFTDKQIRAFKEYGTIVEEEINRAEQAKQRAARDDYASMAMERAIGKATTTSKSFLSDTDASKLQKIKDESAEAVKAQEEARSKDLENASRYDKRIVQIKAETSRKLAEVGKSQVTASRTALESMAVDLAKANDVYGDGEGALAALQKKHAEYTRTLGAANPKVKEFSELIAYANQHMGKTPAEVAKVNNALEDQIDLLNEEMHVRQSLAGLYGDDRADELSRINARAAAQKAFDKAKKDGANETTAAHARLLTLVNEEDKIAARKDNASRSVAVNYSGAAYEAEKRDIAATYELASKHTSDQEALERGKNERLAEVEEKRLQATGRAQDGMTAALRKYSREAGNDGANMFDMWTTSIKGTEDALVQMGATGEISLTSLFATMRAELIRTQMVRPAMSAFTGALENGSLFSGLGNFFSGIFHDGGTVGETSAPQRAVSPALFAGAPRFHNGLASDEYPAILQTGEDVISRRQKAQMRNAAATASASPAAPVQVVVQNYTGAPVKTQETTGAGGQRQLQVIVGEMVKGAFDGGLMDRTMSKNYGIQRRGF
jgi:tape measure domain-containing protein